MATCDVAIVGGGIAGAALGTVLARSGFEVVILEKETVYRDKARGEIFHPWGLAEVIRLGLHDVLLNASGGHATHVVRYAEGVSPEDAESRAIRMDVLLPGVPGSLNVGHPDACEALAVSATEAGAVMIRGVSDVKVAPGANPLVGYRNGCTRHQLRCRFVVGADGRSSAVRRQIGITLHETRPRVMGTGLLVEGLSDWPSTRVALGTEGDVHFFVIPRPAGRARLCLLWDVMQKGRFTGPNRQWDFLNTFRLNCLPASGNSIRASIPAGPCSSYPMNDAWNDQPFIDGVVLVGDAAGWNDPVIGQGLSVAMRDARVVADICRTSSNVSKLDFRPYAEERKERMRRLRLSARLATKIYCTFGTEGIEQRLDWKQRTDGDDLIKSLTLCRFIGPEKVPAEAYDSKNLTRMFDWTFWEDCFSIAA